MSTVTYFDDFRTSFAETNVSEQLLCAGPSFRLGPCLQYVFLFTYA